MSHYRRRYAARRKQKEAPCDDDYQERKAIQFQPVLGTAFCSDSNPGGTGDVSSEPAAKKEGESVMPEGAACYICLDCGPDEGGRPLVRDCSCHGDTMGFVHLSCLVGYAEQKTKPLVMDSEGNSGHWISCPICKQPYQNQLKQDMVEAFLSFAEREHQELERAGGSVHDKTLSQFRVMDALRAYYVYHPNMEPDKGALFPWVEGGIGGKKHALVNRLLSMVEQLKQDTQLTDEWLHMPRDSSEFKVYRVLRGRYEVSGYVQLSQMFAFEDTELGYRNAIKYTEKARVISELVGKGSQAKVYQTMIDLFKHKLELNRVDSTTPGLAKSESETACQQKEEAWKTMRKNLHGATSAYLTETDEGDSFCGSAMTMDLFRVETLKLDGDMDEAKALATRLATESRRVNGPRHNHTINAEKALDELVTGDGGREKNSTGDNDLLR